MKRTLVGQVGRVGKYAYRFTFLLDIRRPGARSTELLFRLDTGTDFMTIPQWIAEREGIPFSKSYPIRPMTAAGRAEKDHFISPVYFSFPQLPDWEFKAECSFSPYNLPYCLFSLTDFAPHFVVRSHKASVGFPYGSVVFQLRSDHGGRRV